MNYYTNNKTSDLNQKSMKPLVTIQTYEDRINAANPQESNDRLTQLLNNDIEDKSNCYSSVTSNHRQDVPPPPPPLPNGYSSNKLPSQSVKPKQKAPPPPVPVKTSTLSSFSTFHQPPPCPTPDYDTLSLNSNSTLPRSMAKKPVNRTTSHNPSATTSSRNSDRVEMESLDSFVIHNPTSNPKPPSTYFHNGMTDTLDASSMNKKPLSNVTIGEYDGARRKMPGKFDFLNGSPAGNESHQDSVNSQFASELAQTLHRSNLRRRTESMENILNHPQIMRNDENGSVRISVNNNPNRQLNNLENISKALTNRVKINIAPDIKKNDVIAPNGILKNGGGTNGSSTGNGQP